MSRREGSEKRATNFEKREKASTHVSHRENGEDNMRGKSLKPRGLLLLLWAALSVSAFGVTGRPSTITYMDATGQRRIYSFAVADCIVVVDNTCAPQHLVVNHLLNGAWSWEDLGLPAGATAVGVPTAVTYQDASGQHVYAFATASGGAVDKHLVVDSGDGSTWNWSDMGAGADNSGVQDIGSAVTFVDSTGHQRIYVFVAEFSGRLAARCWNGFFWAWYDLGVPNGATYVRGGSSVSYSVTASAGNYQELEAFVSADNGHLFGASASAAGCSLVRTLWGVFLYCPPVTWQWTDYGFAPIHMHSPSLASFWPSAITYLDAAGNQQVYVFITGYQPGSFEGGGMLAMQKNNAGISWVDFGVPPGKTGVEPTASAITYVDASGYQQIYVFAEANDGHLVTWNTVNGGWTDQGLPSGKTAVYSPSAITYVIPGCQGFCPPYSTAPRQEIETFAVANDGHLVLDQNAYTTVYSLFGGPRLLETWYWTDQGTM